MKRNEKKRLITQAATLMGAAGGGAVGVVLGGPVGAAVGAAAGAGLPWAVNALPGLIDRIPGVGRKVRQRAVTIEVRRKLWLEFECSAPSDSQAALALLAEEATAITNTPDFGLQAKVRRVEPPSAASSPYSDIERLREASPIRVVCPSICPSVVSVFKSLALQLLQSDVKLQVDFSPKNSGEITRRYPSERWDFCAMARLAIPATDASVDALLLQVAPLFSVSQYMLCRPVLRRESQPRRVLVVRDSPSEAQYWLQQEVHHGAQIDLINQKEIVRIAETLRDDEYLIIWEPDATWVAKEYDLQLQKDTEFKFLISLLVSADWVTQHGAERVHTFYNVFRKQWIFGRENQRQMQRSLAKDSAYLEAFCASMGIQFVRSSSSE